MLFDLFELNVLFLITEIDGGDSLWKGVYESCAQYVEAIQREFPTKNACYVLSRCCRTLSLCLTVDDVTCDPLLRQA